MKTGWPSRDRKEEKHTGINKTMKTSKKEEADGEEEEEEEQEEEEAKRKKKSGRRRTRRRSSRRLRRKKADGKTNESKQDGQTQINSLFTFLSRQCGRPSNKTKRCK